MHNEYINETAALITRDFELETQPQDDWSEEELFQLLANHIAYLIEYRLEFLLSLMYRLDIDEAKVSKALSPLGEEAPNIALARIVLERQKQRAFTKKNYKPEDLGEEWEF